MGQLIFNYMAKGDRKNGNEAKVDQREKDLTYKIRDPMAKALYVRRKGFAEGKEGCENLSNEELEYLVNVLDNGGRSLDDKLERRAVIDIKPPRKGRISTNGSGKWVLPEINENKDEE